MNYAVYWLILWKPIQSNLNNYVQTSDNRIEKMFYNECINCSYWKLPNRNAGWHKPNIISASHKMFVIYNKERKNSSNTNIPNNHKTYSVVVNKKYTVKYSMTIFNLMHNSRTWRFIIKKSSFIIASTSKCMLNWTTYTTFTGRDICMLLQNNILFFPI